MVGGTVRLKVDKADVTPSKVVAEMKAVTVPGAGKPKLDSVSLTARAGEILCLAGVEGNGQQQAIECLTGQIAYQGSVTVLGEEVRGKSIRKIRDLGMAHIPEDRMTVGCVSTMSIMDNVMADRFDRPENMKGIFLDQQKAIAQTDALIKEFEISCDDRSEEIRLLSGGNIQKVVVAREFTSGANFVLANQPTRGVDVGTAEMIRKYLVRQVREKQIASLLISADLNEVLEVSDRLLVIRQGKIVAAFSKASMVSEDELGEYMLGIKTMTPDEMEGLL